MAKVDQDAPKKDEPVAVPNHTEKIKSQVLEKVGRPPRLHRVEVCRQHDGNYRVNIWEQLEPVGDSVLSMGVHIRYRHGFIFLRGVLIDLCHYFLGH